MQNKRITVSLPKNFTYSGFLDNIKKSSLCIVGNGNIEY